MNLRQYQKVCVLQRIRLIDLHKRQDGKTLKQLAAEVGIRYEAAKKIIDKSKKGHIFDKDKCHCPKHASLQKKSMDRTRKKLRIQIKSEVSNSLSQNCMDDSKIDHLQNKFKAQPTGITDSLQGQNMRVPKSLKSQQKTYGENVYPVLMQDPEDTFEDFLNHFSLPLELSTTGMNMLMAPQNNLKN